MTTTKKITKRDRYNELLTYAEVQANPDMVEFIQHEIDLLNKKNSTDGEKKVNEAKANAMTVLDAYLLTVEGASVKDCMTAIGSESSQFTVSALTQLKNDGKVILDKVKGKSVYRHA